VKNKTSIRSKTGTTITTTTNKNGVLSARPFSFAKKKINQLFNNTSNKGKGEAKNPYLPKDFKPATSSNNCTSTESALSQQKTKPEIRWLG
jgi:hypothetical protein